MIEDWEHIYECEDCGAIFIIKPDTDEEVKFCPQCCNSEDTFKKLNKECCNEPGNSFN